MADSEQLLILETHRANLAGTKTFEEYRNHHVAYVDMLIEMERARLVKEEATTKFIYRYVEPATAEAVTTVGEVSAEPDKV